MTHFLAHKDSHATRRFAAQNQKTNWGMMDLVMILSYYVIFKWWICRFIPNGLICSHCSERGCLISKLSMNSSISSVSTMWWISQFQHKLPQYWTLSRKWEKTARFIDFIQSYCSAWLWERKERTSLSGAFSKKLCCNLGTDKSEQPGVEQDETESAKSSVLAETKIGQSFLQRISSRLADFECNKDTAHGQKVVLPD